MNVKLVLAILVIGAVQIGTPAYLIVRHEQTLREGEVFRFHTAPVDPYDAFRGRYVALSLEPNRVKVEDARTWPGGRRTVYITLDRDADGFAVPRSASLRRPREGTYVRAEAWRPDGEGTSRLRWPMDRFYLPEDEAPMAERAYREHSRRERRDAEVRVRVRGGDVVTEDLLVAGRPIRQWLADPVQEGVTP